MNLFEINKEIMNCVDAETGELLDEERFEGLQMDMQTKLENLGCWIKNLESDAAALKAEETAFADRRKALERKTESIKKYLSTFLAGKAFETPKVKIGFRKSEVLEVDEGVEGMLPDEFLRFKNPEINKADLKKAVKNGLKIDGVRLVSKENISIK